jgi:speckle-type POZ protein
MPASSPAADGAPWRSASAIVAGSLSGYHVLKVVGYSLTKDVPNGKSIKSRPFMVGGRKWHVEYKPNGNKAENIDFISLHLFLDDNVTEAVKASAKFSLLDQDGKPVPSYSFTTNLINFTEMRNWGYSKFIKREVLEKSEHLTNDSFSVRFDVTVMKDFHTQDTPIVVVPPSDMHRHFGDFLSSKEGADVKFQVRNKTFSAHRSILAARSPVFKKALLGPMKEGAISNTIPIDDMEAEVFGALLTFMYTDELPDMKEQEESAVVQHLLVAADRYNLERLKLICEDKLCNHITTDSAASILALAEQHNCSGLKEACFNFLSTSTTLNAVMETEGFEYLTKNCPSVLKELLSKGASV